MPDTVQPSTQQFLDIYDITNDLLILKDGSTAVIITVDAMNFGLLAEEEQDAVMYAYAGLLNSLNYPIQIVVQSKTKDVTNYLRRLQEQEETAASDVIRRRIQQYRQFVSELIHERNVLDKRFYVVVPASSLEMGFVAAGSFVPGKKQAFDVSTVERSVILEKATNILDPKRDHLISQFARIGLYSRQLVTQEIIQLFYISYNPEAAEGQEITNSQDYTSPIVHAQVENSLLEQVVGGMQANPSPATAASPTQAVAPQVYQAGAPQVADSTQAQPGPVAPSNPEPTI